MIKRLFIAVLLFMFSISLELQAVTLKAKVLIERTELFVGEPVVLQIQVSGSENPEEPDLSHVKDFVVELKGGRQKTVRSIKLKDSEETQNIKEEYTFFYRIIPRHEGRLIIPEIIVSGDGGSTRTKPIVINVRKSVDTEDFKLRIKLSKDQCYVGEPIILTVVWYIGKDVRKYNFNLPQLEDKHFRFADIEVDAQSNKKLYRIPFGNIQVMGEEGNGYLDGKEYTTITFGKILIPVISGRVNINSATMNFRTLAGNQKEKDLTSDNLSPDFLDNVYKVYKDAVIHSNSLTLIISELPEDGRPSNFVGHVGLFRIKASASPTKARVGDPIILTLSLSGPDYVEHVGLPDLTQQTNLTQNFKVAREWVTAKVAGKTKIFNQTIRPLNSEVKEIPPVELPYFDTEKGKYLITKSDPISLTVKEAKLINQPEFDDVSNTKVERNDIQTWDKGIVFNYKGLSVLEKQYLSPIKCFWEKLWWPAIVFCPLIIFIILLSGVFVYRKRNNDPMKGLSRKAHNKLKIKLHKIAVDKPENVCELILDSIKEYLGVKFRMTSGGSITFADVQQRLESSGVEQSIIERLKVLFITYEAKMYAGNNVSENSDFLINEGISIVDDLEKRLK